MIVGVVAAVTAAALALAPSVPSSEADAGRPDARAGILEVVPGRLYVCPFDNRRVLEPSDCP